MYIEIRKEPTNTEGYFWEDFTEFAEYYGLPREEAYWLGWWDCWRAAIDAVRSGSAVS